MNSNDRKIYHLVPILAFSAWPFMGFASNNKADFIDYQVVAIAWLASLAALAALYLAVRGVIRTSILQRRCIYTGCVAFALFFTFGTIDGALKSALDVERARFVILVWAIVLVLGVLVVWQVSRSPGGALAVGVVGGAMTLVATLDVAINRLSAPPPRDASVARETTGGARPNVYYFLFDGYGRDDALRAALGFDNAPFLNDLETHGFRILGGSEANYPMTRLSVSATLNMDYLVPPGRGALSGYVKYQTILAGHNETVRMFRSLGYTYLHAQPGGWAGTSCRGVQDVCIRARARGLGETEIALLAMTPLEVVLRKVRPHWLAFERTHLPMVVAHLRALRRSVRGPVFAFAHIIIPHDPIYHADCRHRVLGQRFAEGLAQELKADYVDTIRCLNRQALDHLPRLISDDPGAIVIVQSDHGFYFGESFSRPFDDWPAREAGWRYGILNAIRSPEGCRGYLYRTMSSVNTFRFVRGCVLDQAPNYLPDRSFFAAYDREDVLFRAETAYPAGDGAKHGEP